MKKINFGKTLYFFAGLILFVIASVGFVFIKTKTSNNANIDNTTVENIAASIQAGNSLSSQNNIKAQVKEEEPKVFWIKPGQPPICPKDYPIKAKYSSSIGYFYTTENKMYDRVKPFLCFSSEDYAVNVAGFIKKY